MKCFEWFIMDFIQWRKRSVKKARQKRSFKQAAGRSVCFFLNSFGIFAIIQKKKKRTRKTKNCWSEKPHLWSGHQSERLPKWDVWFVYRSGSAIPLTRTAVYCIPLRPTSFYYFLWFNIQDAESNRLRNTKAWHSSSWRHLFAPHGWRITGVRTVSVSFPLHPARKPKEKSTSLTVPHFEHSNLIARLTHTE